jgi:predicted S18 family serine protease
MVMYLLVLFAHKDDSGGLDVHFLSGPGRLSQKAQAATARAISGAARAMGLSADTWSVGLSVPYPGLLIDGDSLSAMVALAVVAMAKGEPVPRHRVISGTITSDGRIGPVGHVALKVSAANQAGLSMILVSSAASEGLAMPSPIQVSQVSTVSQAYRTLMAPRSLFADGHSHASDANRS